MNSIYAGLGIPPTLTGTFGAAGTTNNFISLKTLTQRLQYGRDILVSFWEKEIELVQKAMGFKYPAKIEFDRMDLSNEDTEKSLLIQLADRNIISDELIQTRFGFDPDMEKSRLNRENRERDSSRMVNKAGPWFDPDPDAALKKIALQTGVVAPSQVGLELEKKKSSEKSALDMKTPSLSAPSTKLANDSPESLPGVPGQGRPKNSKDSQQRKTKVFKPQTGAKLLLWASDTQDKISQIVNPVLLQFFNKKNLRSLSNEEVKELDSIKTKLLFNLQPFTTISTDIILQSLNDIDSSPEIIQAYSSWLKELKLDLNKDLTVDELKQAKASFYCMVYSLV
jgi:hypothetical protein